MITHVSCFTCKLMKYHVDNLIVVEGKEDVCFLSSFIDATYVQTKGYNLCKKDLPFVLEASKRKPVIVFTDPDKAGEEIRDKINDILVNKIDIKVDLDKCTRGAKNGVAECDKEEIIRVLRPYFTKNDKKYELTLDDFIAVGVDDTDKRNWLCDRLNLGKCNTKTMVKRANFLHLDKSTLEKEMSKYGN